MDTRIIAETPEIVLATTWREILREAGIHAEIVGMGLDGVYPGVPQLGGSYRLLVLETDCERARSLLEEAEAEAGRSPDDEGGGV